MGKLVVIVNNIYEIGIVPSDWLRSAFVFLPKQRNLTTCCDQCKIILTSHVLKLFPKGIYERILENWKQTSATRILTFDPVKVTNDEHSAKYRSGWRWHKDKSISNKWSRTNSRRRNSLRCEITLCAVSTSFQH